MATTVRVEEAKRRIRELQEAWHRARGGRPTQGELVGEAMAFLERHRDAFLAEAAWEPLRDDEIDDLAKLRAAPGEEGDYDVDEVVYG